MTLPPPRYATIGLETYLREVALPIVLPPGEPSSWTSALHLFGAFPLVAKDDRGMVDLLDDDLLRMILRSFGRPTRDEERLPLLLTTPIPGDRDLAQVLAPLLKHKTYWVRQRVAILIGLLGLEGALDGLVANLMDSDNDARRGAAEGLGRLGSAEAIQALVRGPWEDSDASVDMARCAALARIGDWERTASAVAETTASGDGFELLQVMVAAHRTGDGTVLIERMEAGDDEVKRAGARFLLGHPAVTARHVTAVGELLQSIDDTDTLIPLAYALGAVGEDAIEVIEELLSAGEWRHRQAGCMAACHLGEAGAAIATPLVATLSDDDSDVQRDAALACSILGIQPEVADARWHNDMSTSYQFAFRAAELSRTKPGAALAGEVMGLVAPTRRLLSVLGLGSSGDADTRGYAALGLALREPEMMAPTLDAMARDDSRDVPIGLRRWCAGGLLLTGVAPAKLGLAHRILLAHEGAVSSQPGGGIEGLDGRCGELACLAAKDGDWPVRIDALRLMQRLSGEVGAFADLIGHIAEHDSDTDCRKQARNMLGHAWHQTSVADDLAAVLAGTRRAGDEAKAAALNRVMSADPTLGGVLAGRFIRSDKRELARAASRILGSGLTSSTAPAEVAAALGRLEADGWVEREAACDLLGALPAGAVNNDLLEELCEALAVRVSDDHDSDVQSAARQALARLGRPLAEEE
jgi:HEAT repeat protein